MIKKNAAIAGVFNEHEFTRRHYSSEMKARTVERIQLRKEEIDQQHRRDKIEKLKKWETYKEEKEK